VQVAAVVVDWNGRVMSWGWNNSGRDGYGEHAEAAAIRRANPWRLKGATIYVAGKRSKPVMSRPCKDCLKLLAGYGISRAAYTIGHGDWFEEIV
jgi:pyrimidine deaminase RibD-like protein